jgi:hypothetical protein
MSLESTAIDYDLRLTILDCIYNIVSPDPGCRDRDTVVPSGLSGCP